MELHIQIKLDGEGLPTMDDLDARYALEDAIEDGGLGEVIEAGGGLGVMDVFIQVEDLDRAEEGITAIVAEMGLSSLARITRVEHTQDGSAL